jgi:excisionase family DNA binding protein
MHTLAHQRPYWSISEVALELGVSAEIIRRKIASGELPATQLGGPGSTVRVSRVALESWLTSHARS